MTLLPAAPSISLPLRLIQRAVIGEDDWGQPIVEETPVECRGYFYTLGGDDPDREGAVTTDTGKVILFPPPGVRPHEWLAIEADIDGKNRRWEIVGKPEPKFSLARGGQLHHYELLVTWGAA